MYKYPQNQVPNTINEDPNEHSPTNANTKKNLFKISSSHN